MRSRYALALSAVLPLLLLSFAQCQSANDPSGNYGIVPFHTYLGENENIDVGTGNVHLQIPLVHLPGRNGHDYVSSLSYNSQIWHPETYIDGIGNPHYIWVMNTGWKVVVDGQYQILNDSNITPNVNTHGLNVLCQANFRAQGMDGRVILFPDIVLGCYNANNYQQSLPQYNNYTSSASVTGGTPPVGINACGDYSVMTAGESQLKLENGETFNIYTSNMDSNGNMVTVSSSLKLDTIGRTILQGSTNGNTQTVNYQDSNGTTQTVTINWQQYTLHPTFGLSQPPDPGSPTATLIQSVVLANNDRYDFQYDNYGGLSQITYPTGGYTKYVYATVSEYLREVTEKHVCRDTNTRTSGTCSAEDITTFSPTPCSNCGNGYGSTSNSGNTVINPVGDKTVYSFTLQTGSPLESNRVIYSGTTTPLKTIATTNSCAGPTQQITTLNDTGQQSEIQWDHDSTTLYGYQTTTSGATSAVTAKREYDFNHLPPTYQPVRQTITNWLHINPINSLDYRLSTIRILDRKASEIVKDGSGNPLAETDYEYDNYTTPMQASGATQLDPAHLATATPLITARGNVTAIKRWLNSGGTLLTTNNTYDDAGNVLSTTDPAGHTTTFSYADNFTDGVNHNAKAFVTQTTMPNTGVAHVSKKQYYFNTSLPSASCGENFTGANCLNNVSLPPYQPDYATFTYERLGRARVANSGDGGQTSNCYSDDPDGPCYSTNAQLSQNVTQLITASISKTSTSLMDGTGNVLQSQLTSDPDGTDFVDTTYDGAGRKKNVSNPHRSGSSSTDGTTQYTTYDGLNRVKLVTQPDNSTVSTTYSGNTTTVTDEAGKQRKSVFDALGRLTQVFEDPATLNYETDYTYDALNNLLTVTQKGGDPNSANWRPRTFTYDFLSRLLTASNPESGLITYKYEADTSCNAPNSYPTLLVSKTDARGIRTCMRYDALNRVTQKNYSTSDPAVNYSYDAFVSGTNYGIGRRTGMTDASGSSSWTYDTMGRTWSEAHTISGFNKTISNLYNLDGSIQQVTYPSGSVLVYTYSGAARLTLVKDTTHSVTYMQTPAAGTPAYFPPGQLNQATFGSVIETSIYNNRFQPCWFYATTGTALAAGTLCTGSSAAANVLDLKYSFGWGTNDNGNVLGLTNDKDSNRSVSFVYDALNRISSATTPNTDCTVLPSGITKNWGETMTIDPWGNLTNRTVTKCSADPLSVVALANNRLSGFGYDASGNMTSNGGASYTYNAESQLATTAGVTYTYDGGGNRVKKSNGTLYWGAGPMLESDGSGNFQREFVFAGGGKRIARRDISTGLPYFYFTDQLGSSDVVTNSAGVIQNESDYYPYGGERVYSQTLANQNYKFTGKERDSESGLDNFGARFDASSLGRFMTTDPLLNSGRPWNPQTWNRYVYAGNNPLAIIDPTGLYDLNNTCDQDDKKCNKQFQQHAAELKKGLENLQKKVDKMKDGPEKTRLQNALTALGTEDDDNNVNVTFRSLPGTAAGKTDPIPNPNGGPYAGFNMTIDPSKETLGANGYAIDASHEGTHVSDFENYQLNPATQMTDFQIEYRGYETSAWAAQALGLDNINYRGIQIWNSSWKTVDRQTLQDRGITRVVTDKDHPEVQPHDPFPNQ